MYQHFWSDRENLLRRILTASSFTDALGAWVCAPLRTHVVSLRFAGTVTDPQAAAALRLPSPECAPGGRIQQRAVAFRRQPDDTIVGSATAVVLLDHPALQPVRDQLIAGGNLGRILLCLNRCRVTLSWDRPLSRPDGCAAPALQIRSRLDVNGIPVSYQHEIVYGAALSRPAQAREPARWGIADRVSA